MFHQIIILLLCLTSSHTLWNREFQTEYGSIAHWPTELFEGSRSCARYNLTQYEAKARIAGGDLAATNMFPYQAGLLVLRAPRSVFQCGGSLIAPHYVLTAAHCIYRASLGRVYLGTVLFADEQNAQLVVNVTFRDFYVHEHYSSTQRFDDIGLIYLPVAAKFSSAVQPIALAKPFMTQQLLEQEIVTASGWGLTSEAERTESMFMPNRQSILPLRFVDAPIIAMAHCACYFLTGIVRTPYHICTDGTGERGSCEGDSGGPLTFEYKNVPYLVGITSFGSAGGCDINFPSVYTRITSYLNWISKHTGINITKT